uniref:Bm13211 n=1 Tax=Brugia malayi TaxID=6279 RepID=A0A1I9G5X5_BRUMA|nr:Bm13211 [Brugia malayi]
MEYSEQTDSYFLENCLSQSTALLKDVRFLAVHIFSTNNALIRFIDRAVYDLN